MIDTFWHYYFKYTPIVFWPILYPIMILHELLHLLFMLIFRIPIVCIGLGTINHDRYINIGFQVTGYILFEYENVNNLSDLSYQNLYALFISCSAPFVLLIFAIYITWLYPFILGIPLFYFVVAHVYDIEQMDEILTAIAVKKRIEKSSKIDS